MRKVERLLEKGDTSRYSAQRESLYVRPFRKCTFLKQASKQKRDVTLFWYKLTFEFGLGFVQKRKDMPFDCICKLANVPRFKLTMTDCVSTLLGQTRPGALSPNALCPGINRHHQQRLVGLGNGIALHNTGSGLETGFGVTPLVEGNTDYSALHFLLYSLSLSLFLPQLTYLR